MTVMISRAGLFSSPNRQIRSQNCVPVVSNRCRSVKLRPARARWSISSSRCDFYSRRVFVARSEVYPKRGSSRFLSVRAQLVDDDIFRQALGRIGTGHKWWENGLPPNMKEVTSAQNLVDSLSNAGDKLVVVDFFSPGCGGCKALHPKICQIAGTNPDVQFLHVNYEEHKPMCYSLNVHVLPFFRFYRGAEGRVCSFSCTNATIKKFRDALAKHIPDRCGLEPAKGLDEKELLALSANRDVSFNYTPTEKELVLKAANEGLPLPLPLSLPSSTSPLLQGSENQSIVNSGR